MDLSITESDDLFTKKLDFYWENTIKVKNEIMNKITKANSLLRDIHSELVKINDLTKDKPEVVQIVSGFLAMVNDFSSELRSFTAIDTKYDGKTGKVSEEDRLDVVAMYERNEYLNFKLAQLMDTLHNTFNNVLSTNTTISDVTRSHITRILERARQ